MTDSALPLAADAAAPSASKPQRPRNRSARRQAETRPMAAPPARSNPLLEKLADFYPQLFGTNFLPLKRGIFQDLLAAHPQVFERDALKAALAFHTRSTRYLTAMASGEKRHDLHGQAVEDTAPEHVYHALVEVFRRRQTRTQEDLKPKLRNRIAQAFEASGLSRADYAERVRTNDEAANILLDESLAEAAGRAAKDEALLRAFTASGQTVEAFANDYGFDVQNASRMLERARKRIDATAD